MIFVESNESEQRIDVLFERKILFTSHEQRVYEIIHFPLQEKLVSCSRDKRILIWNEKTGEIDFTFKDVVHIYDLSKWNENSFLAASSNGIIRLFSIDGKIIEEFPYLSGGIDCVAYTLMKLDDDRFLCLGFVTHTVRLYIISLSKKREVLMLVPEDEEYEEENKFFNSHKKRIGFSGTTLMKKSQRFKNSFFASTTSGYGETHKEGLVLIDYENNKLLKEYRIFLPEKENSIGGLDGVFKFGSSVQGLDCIVDGKKEYAVVAMGNTKVGSAIHIINSDQDKEIKVSIILRNIVISSFFCHHQKYFIIGDNDGIVLIYNNEDIFRETQTPQMKLLKKWSTIQGLKKDESTEIYKIMMLRNEDKFRGEFIIGSLTENHHEAKFEKVLISNLDFGIGYEFEDLKERIDFIFRSFEEILLPQDQIKILFGNSVLLTSKLFFRLL